MTPKKKNIQSLSEALKTNLRRRKMIREHDKKIDMTMSHQLNNTQKEENNDTNSNK